MDKVVKNVATGMLGWGSECQQLFAGLEGAGELPDRGWGVGRN